MIEINRELFIGKSMDRECYFHSQQKNTCIKITA